MKSVRCCFTVVLWNQSDVKELLLKSNKKIKKKEQENKTPHFVDFLNLFFFFVCFSFEFVEIYVNDDFFFVVR